MKEIIINCHSKGALCEELIILKCLIYKNSNALKSFKFFKSLKFCLRRFESVNLIRRDNRIEHSTVRLEPDVIKKLVKCLDHSALSICKESRYIDGFMPLTMTALASISVVRKKLINLTSDKIEIAQPIKESGIMEIDLGEKVDPASEK